MSNKNEVHFTSKKYNFGDKCTNPDCTFKQHIGAIIHTHNDLDEIY